MTASALKRTIGARLKAARIALGWDEARGQTQAAFYRSMAIGATRGNNWERGLHYPDSDFLVRLDGTYGIDPNWILCGRVRGLPPEIAAPVLEIFNKIAGE